VVTLALFPLMFVLDDRPAEEGNIPAIFKLGVMLQDGVFGLVFAVLVLGFVLGLFITRSPKPARGLATEVHS
jgi:hypothetical protein